MRTPEEIMPMSRKLSATTERNQKQMSIRRTTTPNIGGALATGIGTSFTRIPRAATTLRQRIGRTMLTFVLAMLSGIVLMASPAAAAATRQQIVSVATDELGGMGCSPGYHNSCGINWCAEFARWVWGTAGVSDVRGLNSWAQSFKTYGTERGLYHSRTSGYTPQPGDAIVFDWDHVSSDQYPMDHIAIVTSATSTQVNTIGGNQGDSNFYESKVTRSSYSRGNSDIDGYISPAGVGSAPPVEEPNVGNSVTGDSFTDVLAMDADGKLWLCSNNFIRDDGMPYNSNREVGHGWGNYTRVLT